MTPIFRCSSLDRDLACNGAITLAPLVDPRTGDEGTMGTALHHLSATRICAELGASAPDGLGPHDPTWPSLKASGWISDFYLRHVRDNCPADWALETEAALAYEFDGFVLSGHIDCVAVSPDGTEAMGWDLKTGYDPVDSAEMNWQCLGYIVILKRAYPQLKRATFFVIQPRNDEDEGYERASSVTLENELAIDTAVGGLTQRIIHAIANSDELTPGRIQCKWCPAMLQCEALKEKRDLMKITPEMLANIKRTPDDATLANWVIAAKTLERPMEDAKELAKERIASQGAIISTDGTQITVKTTKGSIKIVDPLGLWAALHAILPGERLAACARWSFTALKDAAAEHLNIHKSGKGTTTGETVITTATGKFVQQGERKTLQFL